MHPLTPRNLQQPSNCCRNPVAVFESQVTATRNRSLIELELHKSPRSKMLKIFRNNFMRKDEFTMKRPQTRRKESGNLDGHHKSFLACFMLYPMLEISMLLMNFTGSGNRGWNPTGVVKILGSQSLLIVLLKFHSYQNDRNLSMVFLQLPSKSWNYACTPMSKLLKA